MIQRLRVERRRKEAPQNRRLAWAWEKVLEKHWLSIWGVRASIKASLCPQCSP